jgi:hypothetical protein
MCRIVAHRPGIGKPSGSRRHERSAPPRRLVATAPAAYLPPPYPLQEPS